MSSCSFYSSWRWSPVRVLRALARRISKFSQLIYVLLIAVPLLWARRVISLPCRLVSGHGAILIMSGEVVVKVASSGRSTLLLEYDHARRMNQAGPEISACVPSYCLYRHALFVCLISEQYQKVPISEALDCAVEVRRKFDTAGLRQGGMPFDKYWPLQVGLADVVERLGSAKARGMESQVRQFLEAGHYQVGLCHGDFHSRNIMRDKAGHVRVIDLDCIRFEGVVELDAVYFALELEWSVSGTLWLETLARAFESGGENIATPLRRFSVQWNETLGLVYLLDRIGQEIINGGFKYAKTQLDRTVSAMAQASTPHK